MPGHRHSGHTVGAVKGELQVDIGNSMNMGLKATRLRQLTLVLVDRTAADTVQRVRKA